MDTVHTPIATLIVASDPYWQEQLQLSLTNPLSKIRYQLHVVGNLSEAWISVQHAAPRFIIIDADQLNGDTLTFIRHIRSTIARPKIVIVVIAAARSARSKVAVYQAGADNYYVKPIDLDSFAMSYPLLVRLQR